MFTLVCHVGRGSLIAQQVKNLPAIQETQGELGSIPGSGRHLGGGNGNPLQYSFLENPMERRNLLATVHGAIKSWTGWSD